MDNDYLDAARRHLADAKLLDKKERYANADHLFGIAAECMLKTIMVGLRAPTARRGGLREHSHKTHIDSLWPEFCAFVGGAGGSAYLPFASHYIPFTYWDINQRYAPTRRFTKGRMENLQRREEIAAMRLALQNAILDGVAG